MYMSQSSANTGPLLAEALMWFRRAAHAGFGVSVWQLENFRLTHPGMRVGVDGLTSPAGQVHVCPDNRAFRRGLCTYNLRRC